MANERENEKGFAASGAGPSGERREPVSAGATSAGNAESGSGASARLPSIALPKGGGAIRGIGEKFAANPVTGTGSLTIPIATSAGRSGFGPQLMLSYDSGAGNGPFGFGWHISLPAITRKTDKGLPQYQDESESDVFLLSGSEDLVPLLQKIGDDWQCECVVRQVDDGEYEVQRYRPRVEGLFARIERWRERRTGEVHWRSITRDNVTTVYGKDNNSRIFDSQTGAGGQPAHIFSWLICETYDDRGNAAVYEYKAEDAAAVDLAQAHETNRSILTRGANRYLKRIKYGNVASRLVQPDLRQMDWLFEVVFDYGEHAPEEPLPQEGGRWLCRHDPFSTYRAGFEVRSYRLCQRVLMFHHFPEEPEVGRNCLVRSTDFVYRNSRNNAADLRQGHPVASFLAAVTQSGYKRQASGGYLKKSLPALEFTYSEAVIQEEIREVDLKSLENLPYGLDGTKYEWVDLDGEGFSGILTEQATTWFYKANLGNARFGPLEPVPVKPSLTALNTGRQQLIDLAGDGQLDLVQFSGTTPGFYERTEQETWEQFKPFSTLPNLRWNDPNLRFVDLTGDGHADILVTEDDVLTWYPSLAEEGFAAAHHVYQTLEAERRARLVFSDGTQSLYLADMSGDGLPDLVRVRNTEVCYWPSLGYGRFGGKVVMDQAPWLDHQEQFEQTRVRLADIDGSGNTDLIYLGRDGVRLYFNQAGNSWSAPHRLQQFPRVDNLSAVTAVDLLSNGTACLVWSSPLPGEMRRPMRYIDLMGGQKPHLLVRSVNNLGAETHVSYTSSAKFYRADKLEGKPWITKLPFPVHVVERVETYDRISRNRFVTRYSYHHGFYNGVEREFRGFGMVEQFDTEEFASLSASAVFPVGENIDMASHVPPVLTRTWFHTGVYIDRAHVSDFFAGLVDKRDLGEYYREPGQSDAQARALLLDDTVLPAGLTLEEEREACRALKGVMLREEIYALDGSPKAPHPYTVTEQNFSVRLLQPRAANRHAVFFTHARESLNYHYERNPHDPRLAHALTLEVDEFGNILQSAAIGYPRRQHDRRLLPDDQDKQTQTLITYIAQRFTNAVDTDEDYRSPLPSEARTYELTGLEVPANHQRFMYTDVFHRAKTASTLSYEQLPTSGRTEKRLIEHVRTLYRRDNLEGPLPLGELQCLALPFETYNLSFTPGLVALIYGERVSDVMLQTHGRYIHNEGDANWWIPSGQMFYSPKGADSPAQELAYASEHFFLPHRYRDPFFTDHVNTEGLLVYDNYNLLLQETCDALGNRVTVGERNVDPTQPPVQLRQDYRVLQPALVMDPNRNRLEVTVDALGMVVGSVVMGKPEEVPVPGDRLDDTFRVDLTQAEIEEFLANPEASLAVALLGNATTRVVYDLNAYQREPGSPVVTATLMRETHTSELIKDQKSQVQINFSYADGLGREIQKKVQAESGPVPLRDAAGAIIGNADGQPQMTQDDASPRWVGNGWTVFNNKGKPVRQYEPFFTDTHRFEFDVRIGVSPVLFYDPMERVVATLHPNHTWEKVVFDAWRQETWDVNDTVLLEAQTDGDVGDFFRRLPQSDYLPTWFGLRTNSAYASAADQRWTDPQTRAAEKQAAQQTAIHAATPAIALFDSLGRTFLTVAHNRFQYSDTAPASAPSEEFYYTRTIFDIEGNQREIRDARDRIIMRYDYDMLGHRIHQASMEAGERWLLKDVVDEPLYTWDSRNHVIRTTYDQLRRPIDSFLSRNGDTEILFAHSIYGEQTQNPESSNLRGQLVQHFDQAGVVTTDAYDFRGNLLRHQRQLTKDYSTTINWSDDVTLDPEIFTGGTRYDALNRPIQLIAPHSNQPGTKVNTLQLTYNEANMLEQLHVWLDESAAPRDLHDPASASLHAVTDIDYDAKGQRQRVDHGNGVSIFYEYDPLTFRLARLLTRRNARDFPEDCPPELEADGPACHVQNLHYTYDPIGNITAIRDHSQQAVYFRNKRVEPSAAYTYDAVYRLLEANAREHLGQVSAPIPHSHNDVPRVGLLHPGDGNAMGRYKERYRYDEVGNFLEMQHRGSDPANPGWTRTYLYNEASLLEPDKQSNRLTSTTIGSTSESYSNGDGYDVHGNMLRMPHLQSIQWDFRDQLQMTSRQAQRKTVDEQHQSERTWYVYDSTGQRVRKVTESNTGQVKNERLYLGGFEIYRRNGVNPVVCETLHIMDDKRRLALVDTRTTGHNAPECVIRYQFANHLGSSSLELDQEARLISYEEYSPYGSTSYQAVQSQTQVPKRYRFCGKERDEESGLYYHFARYFAPHLGRWISADPIGIDDDLNLYAYARCNPVLRVDPNGTFSKKTYDDWLNKQISANEADVKQKTANLNANKTAKKGSQDRLVEIEGEKTTLQAEKKAVADKRKPLESKKTKLSKQEAKELKELKTKNTKIVGRLTKLQTEKGQLDSKVISLTGKIKQQESGLANATANLESVKDLKTKFDTTYAKAIAKLPKADVELLTDIVMNEARDTNVTAKTAIAYAYTNDTAHHMKGGHVAPPPKKGSGSISHFSATVTESRFKASSDKASYIGQIIESLEASQKRLTDTANTGDPTKGATNWVSPDAPGMKTKFPPNGIPSWAQSMTQIIAPGVPAGVFTFFK